MRKVSVTRNIGAAAISHIVRYSAPLITYPLLTRGLGADGFAKFSLILAASLILSQFIEFGFGLMGVREIAQSDEKIVKLAVGEIVLGRLLTGTIAIIAYIVFVPFLNIDQLKSADAIISCIILSTAYGLSASWYYIGAEIVPKLAKIDIACALSTLILVYFIIDKSSQASLAILLFAIPLWISVIYGHFLALKNLGISKPPLSELFIRAKSAIRFFTLAGIPNVVGRTSIVFLGAFSSPSQVAFYAAGDRLISAATNATQPFLRVLIPRISNLLISNPSDAHKLFKRATIALVCLATVSSCIAALMMPWFVPWFFGPQLSGATLVVIAQLAILPGVFANRSIGMLGLVPLRREQTYQWLTLGMAALSFIAYPLAAIWGDAVTLALSRAFLELGFGIACLICLLRIPHAWNRLV